MCEISYTFCQVISRENCLPLLIISEVRIFVDYHRHSDIKQMFLFRA